MNKEALEAAKQAVKDMAAETALLPESVANDKHLRGAIQAYLSALPDPEGVRERLRALKWENGCEEHEEACDDAADALARLQAEREVSLREKQDLAYEAQAAEAERDKLATGIAEAAARAGIYNDEAPLSGPQLLMLLEHLADGARKAQAAEAENAWLKQQFVEKDQAKMAAEAEAARLLEALEPFVDIDSEEDKHLPDDTPVFVRVSGNRPYALSLGNFRRAHAALAQKEPRAPETYVERLEKALQFYADATTWQRLTHEEWRKRYGTDPPTKTSCGRMYFEAPRGFALTHAEYDHGTKARAALAQKGPSDE